MIPLMVLPVLLLAMDSAFAQDADCFRLNLVVESKLVSEPESAYKYWFDKVQSETNKYMWVHKTLRSSPQTPYWGIWMQESGKMITAEVLMLVAIDAYRDRVVAKVYLDRQRKEIKEPWRVKDWKKQWDAWVSFPLKNPRFFYSRIRDDADSAKDRDYRIKITYFAEPDKTLCQKANKPAMDLQAMVDDPLTKKTVGLAENVEKISMKVCHGLLSKFER